MDTTSIWDFGSNIFEGGLLVFVISTSVLLMIVLIVDSVIGSVIRKFGKDKLSYRYVRRIFRVILLFVAIIISMSNVKPIRGITTALMSATGLLTIIGGLAAQESFGNFIAGFFLSIYHPFNVGDVVSLPEKGIIGTVTEMTFRHTVLRTIDNSKVIIPNSVMNTAVLEDKEYGQNVTTRWISLSVAYGTDIPLMKKVIIRAVDETEGSLDIRSQEDIQKGVPRVMIRTEDFLDSGLKILFPVHTRTFRESFTVCGTVREKILHQFGENGIEIPYTKIEVLGDH